MVRGRQGLGATLARGSARSWVVLLLPASSPEGCRRIAVRGLGQAVASRSRQAWIRRPLPVGLGWRRGAVPFRGRPASPASPSKLPESQSGNLAASLGASVTQASCKHHAHSRQPLHKQGASIMHSLCKHSAGTGRVAPVVLHRSCCRASREHRPCIRQAREQRRRSMPGPCEQQSSAGTEHYASSAQALR